MTNSLLRRPRKAPAPVESILAECGPNPARYAAQQMILRPPSDCLETWALTYFTFAKIWETEDVELAHKLQQHSQRMSPTPEGAKYLEKLLAMAHAGPLPPLTSLERAARDKENRKVELALWNRIPSRR